MKKVLLIGLVCLSIAGCKKKQTKCKCATVLEKGIVYTYTSSHYLVNFYDSCMSSMVSVHVTKDLYDSLEVNDEYCVE